MGLDGVMGYIAATCVKAYDTWAAAALPSIVLNTRAIYLPPCACIWFFYLYKFTIPGDACKPSKAVENRIEIVLVLCRLVYYNVKTTFMERSSYNHG